MENINPSLKDLNPDFLYHFGLDSSMDLKGMFGDVKYVCMGGSSVRAEVFAEKAADDLGITLPESLSRITPEFVQQLIDALPPGSDVKNIISSLTDPNRIVQDIAERVSQALIGKKRVQPIGKTERFSLYKTGPVISVSTGMGMPSQSILLNEITKLLYYAGVDNPIFLRIGTSGGIGVSPGTVVVATGAVNGRLLPQYELAKLGKVERWPTPFDPELAQRMFDARGDISAVLGKTCGTDDFYEGQGRLDGALDPDYSEKEKMRFLQLAHAHGVRNFEMEAPGLAAFTKRAGIPTTAMSVALLDRLNGDQVTSTTEELAGFSDRAQKLAINGIEADLNGSV